MQMATLFFTKQFTCTAYLEIVACKCKTCTQCIGSTDCLDTFRSIGGHFFGRWRQQIRIGLMMRAADTATQLMKLGEAEGVSAVDDDGVCARDIDAGFDNG